MNREIADRLSTALALNTLGFVAHAQGQYPEACSRLEESLALFRELGDHWNMARVLSHLGYTLHAMGASAEGYERFLAALELAIKAKAHPSVLDAVIGLATLLQEQGQIEPAAELCSHVLGQPIGSRRTRNRAEKLWSGLKASLPQEQLVVLQERVRATPFETVVAELARGNLEQVWEASVGCRAAQHQAHAGASGRSEPESQ